MTTVYRNTFGADRLEVFTYYQNYHFQIMRALTERGYSDVKGDTAPGNAWMDEEGGYIVHASLEKGGKAVFFMASTMTAIDKVIEALRLSIPGITLHQPVKVDRPE